MIRMINPAVSAPELKPPEMSKLRAGYRKNAFSGVHPDDLEAAIEAFRKGFNMQQFKLKPLRLMTSTGDYIWVAMDVTHRENLPDGRLFYASYRNVTKEIQMQQELEKRGRCLRKALNAADKANEAKSVFLCRPGTEKLLLQNMLRPGSKQLMKAWQAAGFFCVKITI